MNAPQFPFEKLAVWQMAIDLAGGILERLGQARGNSQAGLTSRMANAAVGPAVKIAAGKGGQSQAEFLNHLFQARGAVYEVVTLLEICLHQGLFLPADAQAFRGRCEETDRKIGGLISAIQGGRRGAAGGGDAPPAAGAAADGRFRKR
jgi:four helix bundle protein